MYRLFKITIIFLLVCIITGCSQPVGSISTNSGGSGIYDFMKLEPYRKEYKLNTGDGAHIFNRQEDLRVFVVDSKGSSYIDPSDPGLLLELIFNHGLSSEKTVVLNTHFPFSEAGEYRIRGTYKGKTDFYLVKVEGINVPPPGEGNDFLDFIWL